MSVVYTTRMDPQLIENLIEHGYLPSASTKTPYRSRKTRRRRQSNKPARVKTSTKPRSRPRKTRRRQYP
jgi:hypothetical protein